jgi:integrating conjugative element protein (TIGR03749 family)
MTCRHMCGSRAINVAVLGLLCTSSRFSAEAASLEWHNVPLSIVLPVGHERVVSFPDHVQVGLPAALSDRALRTQSVGGTVLWLAHEPFGPLRLQVRLLTTGHVLLIDLTAVESDEATVDPVEVVLPSERSLGEAESAKPLGPVELTRFASQQLYAPERVVTTSPAIRRVPMALEGDVPLYRAGDVAALPLGSWQAGGLFVTAVMLTNRGGERLTLDPRLLRGSFVAATFQHNSLGPAGSRSEATCVYLVTNVPFGAAVRVVEAPVASTEGG